MNKQKCTLIAFILLTLTVVLSGCGGSESNTTTEQVGGQQAQQKIYKWKMVTTWPKNFPGLGMAASVSSSTSGPPGALTVTLCIALS